MQCQCLTTKGKQCARNAKTGSNFCFQHQNCKGPIPITSSTQSQVMAPPMPRTRSVLGDQQNNKDKYTTLIGYSQPGIIKKYVTPFLIPNDCAGITKDGTRCAKALKFVNTDTKSTMDCTKYCFSKDNLTTWLE